MKFSEYISESNKIQQELYNFQLANDSEVSNVSITKDKLSVRYFQRHRKSAQDDKAFKELAKSVFGNKKYSIEYGDFENTAILESYSQIFKFAEKCVKDITPNNLADDTDFLNALDVNFEKFGGDKIIKTKLEYKNFVNRAVGEFTHKYGVATAQGLGLLDSAFIKGLEDYCD